MKKYYSKLLLIIISIGILLSVSSCGVWLDPMAPHGYPPPPPRHRHYRPAPPPPPPPHHHHRPPRHHH